MGAKASVAWFL